MWNSIRSRFIGLSATILLVLTGCSALMVSEPVRYVTPEEATFVPPGYMPPPDKCRIWLPDTPPQRQPPPGDCSELRWQIPAGAALVYGS